MSMFGRPIQLLTLLCLGAAALLPHAPDARAQDGGAAGASASSDTVHVAAPTGEEATDRASILAALEQVRPGGTVQFAAGTYLIGGIIRVPADEITLLGHSDGTVIRGCGPDDFPELPEAYFACHGFELTGARQTVRNLTFEYTWHGLFVGCCFPADREALESGEVGPLRSQPGGHLIESNTFRYTPNGLRVIGESAEPTVHLTYLAEHHPDRVAGVIYLAGLLTPWLREVRDSDPAGAGLMASRASAPDGLARERLDALMSYRPEFLAGDRPPIEVPALAFVGRSGTIGHERFSEPLALVTHPAVSGGPPNAALWWSAPATREGRYSGSRVHPLQAELMNCLGTCRPGYTERRLHVDLERGVGMIRLPVFPCPSPCEPL